MTQPSDRTSTYAVSEETIAALESQRKPWVWGANPRKADDHMHGGTHYKDMGVQPWNVVDCWPLEQQIGYYRGGALKYVMRLGTKDEQLQEARKAGHYIEKLIEVLAKSNPQGGA